MSESDSSLDSSERNKLSASINWPVNNDNLKQVVAMFVDNATALATQGWGGYLTVCSFLDIVPLFLLIIVRTISLPQEV